MKRKMANQQVKKTYILYKGHTGWRVKTRVLGGLVVTLAALSFTESTSVSDAQAATDTSGAISSSESMPSQKQQVSLRSAPAPSAPAPSARVAASSSVTAQTAASNVSQEAQQTATVDSATITQQTTTPAPTYPVLSPGQDVKVGADTSQVALSGSQIGQHFTATVENRGINDQDADPTDNTHQQAIGADGSISLTTNDPHPYYSSSGSSTSVTGHQVAHVSFEHEIDFSHNFSMTGALGIGSKSNGADSVGFVFAPGDPSAATKGGSGGMLGIEGLKNAFGFVYDQYDNRQDYQDPSGNPYVGWRFTDGNGKLQAAPSGDWQSASALGLTHEGTGTYQFTMNYDAKTQTLTVLLNNQTFSRKIADVSTGYSISVAASTGGSWNDYSAKIDSFSYTPKTIPLEVHLVDSADEGALLNNTTVNAVANIGDTISVFSTPEAASRALAAGVVTDPSLVAIIPADTAGNIYLIDGQQVVANNNGKAHQFGDSSLADATYYTYTVTDQAKQSITVPVRLAFKARVTPVDAITKAPIAGLDPVTVVAVAGEPVLVQIPGYTPTKVILAEPTAGQTIAEDQLLVDQTTTASDTQTTQETANPVGHYYTGNGRTVDGHAVTGTAKVGTGDSIGTGLTAGQQTVIGTSETPTGQDNYYWSNVGNAVATDSTDASQAQATQSILVPTAKTLDFYQQQAVTNQAQAETYKQEAQDLFNEFIALNGLTQNQKDTAQSSLDALLARYTSVSDSNQAAQNAFAAAKQATVDETIYTQGQTGYKNLVQAQNLLAKFKVDLTSLKDSNQTVKESLTTLHSQTITYGDPIKTVEADLGTGFGSTYGGQTISLAAEYVTFTDQEDPATSLATPVNVGKYFINLTAAGRAYLQTLSPDNTDVGLFVSGSLEIDPKDTTATLAPVTVVYGDTPSVQGNLGQGGGDQGLQNGDVEVRTADQQLVTGRLQVGQTYTLSYSPAKQAELQANSNYQYQSFGTARLTVSPRPITVTAQDYGITYGDEDSRQFGLTSDSTVALVKGDQLSDLRVGLVRDAGEQAGTYNISGETDHSQWNPNYQITVTPGTFTIGKKPVTVTVKSPTKIFGTADPTWAVTVPDDSLVGNDSVSDLDVKITRVQGEDVGTYTLGVDAGQTSMMTSANYQVTVLPGKLTIMPAAATVTISPTTVTYGDLPVLTGTLPGTETTLTTADFIFVTNGQTVEPDQLQAGTYTIQLTQAAQDRLKTANPNYTVTLGNDTLTVNRRPITVQVANQVKNAGDSDPVNAVTLVTGSLKANDTLANETLGLTYTRPESEAVGVYQVMASAATPNYEVTVKPGQLTILGVTVDKQGNKTITQKDVGGDVVKVTKQWTDHSTTVYTYDPQSQVVTLSEQVKDKPVVTKTLPLPVKNVIFQDGNGTVTVIQVTDPNAPSITHYRVSPVVTRPSQPATPVKTPIELTDTGQVVNIDYNDPRLRNLPRAIARNRSTFANHSASLQLGNEQRPVQRRRQREASKSTTEQTDSRRPTVTTVKAGQLRLQSRLARRSARSRSLATTLPQTDEANDHFWTILGTALAAWLILPFRRKRP